MVGRRGAHPRPALAVGLEIDEEDPVRLAVAGADDGLAIDDVSITAHEGPVPTVTTTLGAVKGAYR